MDTRVPQISLRRRRGRVSRSNPSSRTASLDISAFRGRYLRIPRAKVLFPEPDSPTKPMTSPRSKVRSTPFTACVCPSSVVQTTLRSFTSNRGRTPSCLRPAEMLATPLPRHEHTPQAVTHEIHGDHECRDSPGGKKQHPRGLAEVVASLVDLQPPVRRRRLHAESQETERSHKENRVRKPN